MKQRGPCMRGGTISLTIPKLKNMEEGLVSPHWLVTTRITPSFPFTDLAKLIQQTSILSLTHNIKKPRRNKTIDLILTLPSITERFDETLSTPTTVFIPLRICFLKDEGLIFPGCRGILDERGCPHQSVWRNQLRSLPRFRGLCISPSLNYIHDHEIHYTLAHCLWLGVCTLQ